jgi:sodium-dependent dicarboxylate transporter 2/3/5
MTDSKLFFKKLLVNPKRLGLALGPLSFIVIIFLFPTSSPAGLSENGKYVLAISVWMIIWWITEAIHVYATALLPLGLMPVMGVLPLENVAAEYMHNIIVLLLGMFLIAIAIERSGFHRKIAYEMIGVFGYSPKRILLGFMISTALLSTVIMSTTVVLIMLPIAFVILNDLNKNNLKVSIRFRTILLLAIAYSSSIGSISTLIGAPPNLLYAGTIKELFNHTVTFAEWSSLAMPLSITMLVIAYFYMSRLIGSDNEISDSKIIIEEEKEVQSKNKTRNLLFEQEFRKIITNEKQKIGKITHQQIIVVGVLILVLLLMFTSPMWLPTDTLITNSVIAILGGISLFAIPMRKSKSLLDWAEVERLPFGLLFLLGGGLALSLAFVESGLANWIANSLSFMNIFPFEIIVILIIGLVMFMSNVKSNTSTAAIFIPIVANMAILNNWSPLPILFGITVATSFAFLLPMGTPPNALVYEKGNISIKDMFVNGIVLNFIAIALISIFTIFISSLFLS